MLVAVDIGMIVEKLGMNGYDGLHKSVYMFRKFRTQAPGQARLACASSEGCSLHGLLLDWLGPGMM